MTEQYKITVTKHRDSTKEIIETLVMNDITRANQYCTNINTIGTGFDSPNHYTRAEWKRI